MRGQRQAIYLQQQSQSSERHESTFGGQSGFCCNELRTSPGLRVWFLEDHSGHAGGSLECSALQPPKTDLDDVLER